MKLVCNSFLLVFFEIQSRSIERSNRKRRINDVLDTPFVCKSVFGCNWWRWTVNIMLNDLRFDLFLFIKNKQSNQFGKLSVWIGFLERHLNGKCKNRNLKMYVKLFTFFFLTIHSPFTSGCWTCVIVSISIWRRLSMFDETMPVALNKSPVAKINMVNPIVEFQIHSRIRLIY